jgi:hypothetical protein
MTVTATPPTQAPTEYIVAQALPPEIVCPRWCTLSSDHHLSELTQLDGRCIHWSGGLGAGGGDINIARTTYPDGALDPSEGTNLFIDVGFQDGVSLEDAAAFAAALTAALEEASK